MSTLVALNEHRERVAVGDVEDLADEDGRSRGFLQREQSEKTTSHGPIWRG